MAGDIERLEGIELADLLPAVSAGARLSRGDCLRMWRTPDLTGLGVLANLARERTSGSRSFFRPAVHVNTTGRPDPACPECTAAIPAGGITFSPDSIPDSGGELHLTGGPDPAVGVDDLCRLVEMAAASRPRLRLRAFTWQQLECAAGKDRKTPAQVLGCLVDAGLTLLAGGAVVDLTPEKTHLDPGVIAAVETRMPWFLAAAELKLKCELALVCGDGDDPEILAGLLDLIRRIQDDRQIFECFVPLAFNWPSDTLDLPIPTGYNHLRAVAIGRLFLDNLPRVRSSPFAVSEPLAQVAQWYGADDAGSVPADCLVPIANAPSRERMLRLLKEAGRDPVEI